MWVQIIKYRAISNGALSFAKCGDAISSASFFFFFTSAVCFCGLDLPLFYPFISIRALLCISRFCSCSKKKKNKSPMKCISLQSDICDVFMRIIFFYLTSYYIYMRAIELIPYYLNCLWRVDCVWLFHMNV